MMLIIRTGSLSLSCLFFISRQWRARVIPVSGANISSYFYPAHLWLIALIAFLGKIGDSFYLTKRCKIPFWIGKRLGYGKPSANSVEEDYQKKEVIRMKII